MNQIFLPQPMIAEVIPMVRRKHDHGGIEQPAHIVLGASTRYKRRHERPINRMGIGLFILRSNRCNNVICIIHRMIRNRHDIRPVRLNVQKMQAPWAFIDRGLLTGVGRT